MKSLVLTWTLATVLAVAATPAFAHESDSHAKTSTAVNEHANPLLTVSPLPFQYPQFDKIEDGDFGPAFDQGMAEHLKEIDAIANVRSVASFDNTIVALEKSGQLLGRATTVFGNLSGADTNDARDKLDTDYSPKFAAHFDSVYLNDNLFNRVNLANPVGNLNAVASGIDSSTGQISNSADFGDFGRINSTSNNPRLIQLALKLNF